MFVRLSETSVTSGPRFVDSKSAFNPLVVYATDHSKTVVMVSSYNVLCGFVDLLPAFHCESCFALYARVLSCLAV